MWRNILIIEPESKQDAIDVRIMRVVRATIGWKPFQSPFIIIAQRHYKSFGKTTHLTRLRKKDTCPLFCAWLWNYNASFVSWHTWCKRSSTALHTKKNRTEMFCFSVIGWLEEKGHDPSWPCWGRLTNLSSCQIGDGLPDLKKRKPLFRLFLTQINWNHCKEPGWVTAKNECEQKLTF